MRLIALVRHGETEAAEAVLAARSRRSLSGRGRAQAAAAAQFLAPVPWARVVASDLPRARETARILADAGPVEDDPRLAPLDLGDWEGAPLDRTPELERRIREPGGRPPGGESLRQLGDRAWAALEEARRAPGNILLVAHRLTNAVLLARALGLGVDVAWLIQQAPGGVSVLIEERGRIRPALVNVTPLDPLRLESRAVGVVSAHGRAAAPVERRLYLLRHAEADMVGADGRIRSHADEPLTRRGREQAAALAELFAAVAPRRVHCSPLARARETAEIVARGAEVCVHDDLREIALGAYEGRTAAEALAAEPRFLADPEARLPGGESFEDVAARVLPALQTILDRDPADEVLVVAHGAVNRALIGGLLGVDAADALRIRQDWACVDVLEYAGGRWWAGALNWTPAGLGELALTRRGAALDEDTWVRLGR